MFPFAAAVKVRFVLIERLSKHRLTLYFNSGKVVSQDWSIFILTYADVGV
jgi:hypothetical protein